MIRFESSGSFSRTDNFLAKMEVFDPATRAQRMALEGVAALRSATPTESGLTSASWDFEIVRSGGGFTIWWKNTNVVDGFNVAIGLQYGHGTGTGGWVAGYDYINPAIRPIFDRIANDVWKEVQRS